MAIKTEVWIHDTRVAGVIHPAPGRKVVRVDQKWRAADIAKAATLASTALGGAYVLWIVSHSSITGASFAEREGGWEDSLFGGVSDLGEQGINSRTVTEFGFALQGYFLESINVLACGAAARWNGMEICRRLAFHSKTLVIASQDTQEYAVDASKGNAIDVGDWEGRVFKFHPNGRDEAWIVNKAATGSEPPTRSVNPTPIYR
jgi:hypothetical protein